MKCKLFLAGILSLALLSCNKEPVVEEKPGEWNVETTDLNFTRLGGTETIKVTTKNIDRWSAYSKESWISLGEPDLVNGTLEVTVLPTEEIGDLESSVVLYSGSEFLSTVRITQKGNGVIHERPTLQRMNLKGEIEELSYYVYPAYVWEANPGHLEALKFNSSGMLESFEFTHYFSPVSNMRVEMSIRYDAQRRIERIEGKTDAVIEGTNDLFEFSFDFEYGSHGKYIETLRLFEYMETHQAFGQYRLWMPTMIKDLAKVKAYNPAIPEVNFEVRIDVIGNDGIGYLEYEKDGGPVSTAMNIYTFENNYPKTMTYPDALLGTVVDFVSHYDIDPVSGYLRSVKTYCPQWAPGEAGKMMEKTYLQNLANSLSSYLELINIGYRMNIEYNANYDIAAIQEDYNHYSTKVSYDYDANGNWTGIRLVDADPAPSISIQESRTIKYK